MRSSDLLSKEWCDVIFENRNKDYGAYALRRQAGMRYRRTLLILLSIFLFFLVLGTGTYLYARRIIKDKMKEAQAALEEMRRADHKDGYELKFLSTARMLPATRITPGAKESTVPAIVDGPTTATPQAGKDGPISYDPDEELIQTPIVDTTGLGNEELPIAKQKIVPTEVVSQIPEFPGGAKAFMKWLDQHIVYPQQCLQRKQEGQLTASFIIGTDGYATDIEIKNAFDVLAYRTVMNALKRMPKWKPGTDQLGNPTPVKITVPILFKQ